MKDSNKVFYLNTELPVNFSIKISPGIFDIGNSELLSFGTQGVNSRRIVVVDLKVSGLYLDDIRKYFKSYDVHCSFIIIDATEENKNIETLLYVLSEIESFGLNRRNEPIIAVGGGALLDIVGMAAGMYRRGVPYIKVPTTLLGLVDASVGVKTGINFQDRRNRLGSYYPPLVAYLDTSFFKTLDDVEISSGLGEILKLAVIKDLKLFKVLENHGSELYKTKFINCIHSDKVISLSIKGMKDELQENLWEKNLKRCVDFGHSFSPIPEMRSLVDESVSTLTHGQAVTLDVIFSSIISHLRGMLSKNEVFLIMNTANDMGLPTNHTYFNNPDIMMEALNDTIKHRNGSQNLPIPTTIGTSIFINDLTYEDIRVAAKIMMELNDEFFK
jgi:2-epi-5-epi-valiolone synthase